MSRNIAAKLYIINYFKAYTLKLIDMQKVCRYEALFFQIRKNVVP